jgi:hypothetical protein
VPGRDDSDVRRRSDRPIGEGIWHCESRCINDPAKPPPKTIDVEWKNGGIIEPGLHVLYAQCRRMPAV